MLHKKAVNGQLSPIVGHNIFVCPELLPGLFIKLYIKNLAEFYLSQLIRDPSSFEQQFSGITATDCSNVKPHYWQ